MSDDLESRQVEKALLGRSHAPEKVKELLDTRYSVTGSQKPFLILTSTLGPPAKEIVNVNQASLSVATGIQKSHKKQDKKRKSRLAHARSSLTQFIHDAQAAQERAQRQLRKTKATVTDEFLIQQKVPVYSQYTALHGLWKDYISNLLSMNPSVNMEVSKQHKLTLASKLASADFHGALLTVVSAKNPSMVGLSGIVVWEARSNFVIVVAANPASSSVRDQVGGIRVVEKRGSLFSFTAGDGDAQQQFDIVGSRFLYRNADRSGRKFKARSVNDL